MSQRELESEFNNASGKNPTEAERLAKLEIERIRRASFSEIPLDSEFNNASSEKTTAAARSLARLSEEDRAKRLADEESERIRRASFPENPADTTTVGTDIGNFFRVLFAFFSGLWNRDFYEFDLLSKVYFPPTPEEPKNVTDRNVNRMRNLRDSMLADPNKKPTAEELASLTAGLSEQELRSLPRKMLRDLIGGAESPRGYNIAQGNRVVNFTSMTVREAMQWQAANQGKGETQAIGRYQIMPKTLAGLVKKYDIDLNAKFDENMQDRLANHLMDQRGYKDYMSGRKPLTDFMLDLSKEWAGLPKDKTGKIYHQDVGSNQRTVSVDLTVTTLENMRKVGDEIATRNSPVIADSGVPAPVALPGPGYTPALPTKPAG
jgi:muramidase (phage lysozyme)